jgi:hypothetical protein
MVLGKMNIQAIWSREFFLAQVAFVGLVVVVVHF